MLLIAVFFLSGCSTLRPPKSSWTFQIKTPMQRQAELAKLKYWRITGAFGVKQLNQRSIIANYEWQQFDRGYRIHIISSLGLYSIEIHGSKKNVILWKNGTEPMAAKTPEGLMQKALGWSLPISNLQYWIKDMPAPQKHGIYKVKYDCFGHMIALQQDGWTLHFGSFSTKAGGIDLPQAIVMDRYNMSVKIVMKEWLLPMHPIKRPQVIV